MEYTGLLYIVSAASGTGKTTLIKELLKLDDSLQVVVSHTTREPREGEEDGKHYHFVDNDTFEGMIANGEFLEYAKVHNHYYGTSHKCVDYIVKNGHNAILEIDVQGAQQVRNLIPNAVSIFILPPSIEALIDRLHLRGHHDENFIKQRLSSVIDEFDQSYLYDFIVINDKFDDAKNALWHIMCAERYTVQRNLDKINFLRLAQDNKV